FRHRGAEDGGDGDRPRAARPAAAVVAAVGGDARHARGHAGVENRRETKEEVCLFSFVYGIQVMLSPIDHWHRLLRDEAAGELCAFVTAEQRARRLRFGDRVLCPFLRPFFLTEADEARVTRVVATLWTLGERVARVALERPGMLAQLALSDDEV